MNNIQIDKVRPNDWNPNTMTNQEFQELVAEIKHLGKVPKPIILRSKDDGYEIVDGEHTYKALIELGYNTLNPDWVEIVDVDDFEAMRQTYKRNQHGTHEKIKDGLLFTRLKEERGLSNVELAEELEMSEGTIRNALEYAKAMEARNSYDDYHRTYYYNRISELPIRAVRDLNNLPTGIGDIWLDHDADPKDYPDNAYKYKGFMDYLKFCRPNSAKDAIEQLKEIEASLRLWGRHIRYYDRRFKEKRKYTGGFTLDPQEALPYFEALATSRWDAFNPGRNKIGLHHLSYDMHKLFEAISIPVDDITAKIVLPLERLEAWIHYPDPMSIMDFQKGVAKAGKEFGATIDGNQDVWITQIENYAPDYIKEAQINGDDATTRRYELWLLDLELKEEGIDENKRKDIVAKVVSVLEPNGIRSISDIYNEISKDTIIEQNTEDFIDNLGGRYELLMAVRKQFTENAKMLSKWDGKISEEFKQWIEPFIQRLELLPEPELAMLVALFTKRGPVYWRVWAKAIGKEWPDEEAK